MKSNIRSLAALNHEAQSRARTAVATCAEKAPAILAAKLAAQPDLANGLKDFEYIVEQLMLGGETANLTKMLDSRSLGLRARRVIVEKLLTA